MAGLPGQIVLREVKIASRVSIAFGLVALLGPAAPARAQLWAPAPLPAGVAVPLNSRTDSQGNVYSVTPDSLIKTTPSGTITSIASVYTNPVLGVRWRYGFRDVVVDASDNVALFEAYQVPE
ncbi:MAG TPA: hypothetical protein VG838_04805 [Opitutaceae bacterium]|nr:hypothetical protein [Opitutaceae bacterium]